MSLINLLQEGHKKVDASPLGFTAPARTPGNSAQLARDYFDSLTLELRVIDSGNAAGTSTRAVFFGTEFSTPITVAALSALNAIRPNGMIEVAKAAAAANVLMWVGIGDEDELKAIIDTGAKVAKIIKPYQDHELIFKKMEQAERCGAIATGMDICFGLGMKNGFAPAPMSLKSRGEIWQFINKSKLPFVLKGILSAHDAKQAIAVSAGGIVASHSGGTVLDSLTPPAKILPHIRSTMGKRANFPVFLDGGVASGLDAFKAIASGADGVCVGRAVMAGLAANGADGVREVLDSFTAELRRAMSLTGASLVRGIEPAVIWETK